MIFIKNDVNCILLSILMRRNAKKNKITNEIFSFCFYNWRELVFTSAWLSIETNQCWHVWTTKRRTNENQLSIFFSLSLSPPFRFNVRTRTSSMDENKMWEGKLRKKKKKLERIHNSQENPSNNQLRILSTEDTQRFGMFSSSFSSSLSCEHTID